MWAHVTNKKRYIPTSVDPMATKPDKMIAYNKWSSPDGYMTQYSLEK